MTTNWFGLDEEEEDEAPKPWTLADIYADLATSTDVVRELDVSMARFNAWVQRRERINCPEPVRTLGNVHIYSMEQWKGWFNAWMKGRKSGTKWTDKAVKAPPALLTVQVDD